MGSSPINPNPTSQEPELHLLLDKKSFQQPLWTSLATQFDEFFFPKKLPPLKLESKPEPVKEIWGFYSNWKVGAAGAAGTYVLIFAGLALTYVIGRHVVAIVEAKPTVTLVDPGDLPALKPSKTQVGGGGGGGDRDVL